MRGREQWGEKREKDCNPESVSMAAGLKEALSVVLIEKGLSSMESKQGCLYVILHQRD